MKPLSQVLNNIPMNASENPRTTSLTRQHGSTPAAGMMNPEATALPHQIDQHLKARLKSLRNLSVTYATATVTDPQHGFLRTREIPQIKGTSIIEVKEIYREVLELCAPAPTDMILREITAMSIGMARRKDQADDYRALLLVYTKDLAEYPEDVIQHATEFMRREIKFFPTISEIRDACEELYEFRRALKSACEHLLEGRVKLAAPVEETHFKAIPQREWNAQHYDWWVEEAERMVDLARQNESVLRADEWLAELARRQAVRDKTKADKAP